MTAKTPMSHPMMAPCALFRTIRAMRRRPNSFGTKYEPVVVTDWAQLEADIDLFIQQGELAIKTIEVYRDHWVAWERHCKDLGVPALGAPYGAFTAFVVELKLDGTPYAASTVLGRLSAIAYEYKKRGVTAAYEECDHAGDWLNLRRGLKRAKRARARTSRPNGSTGVEGDVAPLMRDELQQMLRASPDDSERDRAWAAAVLLSFDCDLSAKSLAGVTIDEVAVGSGVVSIGGRDIPCDHRERVRGVPWDCTACAVRLVVAEHADSCKPLLYRARDVTDLKSALASQLRLLRDTAWRGSSFAHPHAVGQDCSLTPSPDLSDWQVAGLRRALLLRVGPHRRGRYLRAKAWVSVAWASGFRMCGDLVRLDRSHARPAPDGGWTVDLSGSKDDPCGRKEVVRSFAWPMGADPKDTDLSPARYLSEYLCVRDAVQGPSGQLFRARPLTPRDTDVAFVSGQEAAQKDLDALVALAGLDGHSYSSKSCRKGYTNQALEDGWDLDEVRQGLRHLSVGTTFFSYAKRTAARDAASRLHDLVSSEPEP